MKSCSILLIGIALTMIACQKDKDLGNSSFTALAQQSSKSGGSGGGGSTTGFLQNVLSGTASRLVEGSTDSIFVSFTQPAAAGWILNLSSNDPAVQVPATYPVPEGVYGVSPHVTGGALTTAKNVTVNVTLGSQTKSTVLKVFPLHATFPAPSLQKPSNGAKFKSRAQVIFDWNDNVNAYYNHIQIADNTAFINPMLEVLLDNSIWTASYFNGLGVRYWRVRYVDASGAPGPWSAVRNFQVVPQ